MKIKKQLGALKEILQLIEESLKIIKRYPVFFLLVFILLLFYYGAKYYTYDFPQKAIWTFYTSINEKNYDNAWNQLSEKYKEDLYLNNKEDFKIGYSTTNHFGDIKIAHRASTKNPFKEIFNKERVYETTYIVEDRINRRDLTDYGTQAWNSFWVEVKEKKSIELLKESTQNRFIIRRVFNQDIRIIKEYGQWKIAQIKTNEIGLKID